VAKFEARSVGYSVDSAALESTGKSSGTRQYAPLARILYQQINPASLLFQRFPCRCPWLRWRHLSLQPFHKPWPPTVALGHNMGLLFLDHYTWAGSWPWIFFLWRRHGATTTQAALRVVHVPEKRHASNFSAHVRLVNCAGKAAHSAAAKAARSHSCDRGPCWSCWLLHSSESQPVGEGHGDGQGDSGRRKVSHCCGSEQRAPRLLGCLVREGPETAQEQARSHVSTNAAVNLSRWSKADSSRCIHRAESH